jgi:hypothetical protein
MAQRPKRSTTRRGRQQRGSRSSGGRRERPAGLLTGVDTEVTLVQPREAAPDMSGEEAPGGSVAVPDNDRVGDLAAALGVERSLDSPVRASADMLEARDSRRRVE